MIFKKTLNFKLVTRVILKKYITFTPLTLKHKPKSVF